MSKAEGIVMELNGSKYDLTKVLAVAASAPRVTLRGLPINGRSGPARPEHKVTFHNGEPPAAKEVIIFKQHDGYTILFGEDLYANPADTARLLSTPALKKARFEKEEAATPERVQSSSATGAMADKMQQAYSRRQPYTPTHQAGDMDTRRFDAPVRQPRPAGYSDMTTHNPTAPSDPAKSRHNGGPRQYGGRRADKT